jgi:replication factor A1
MRNKVSIGEYLAFLSTKYQIDPDQFFNALALTEKSSEVTCDKLSIRRRGKNQNKTIILIMKGSKVVAQLPISREFLATQNNPIKKFMGTRFANRCINKKNGNSLRLHIKDLRRGMKQINLKAKVLDIPEPKLVLTRFGNYASVSNALITDETGTIKLCLWNDQITSVSIGDTIQIENANMSTFKGESQLRIGRKGKLNNVEQLSPQIEIRGPQKQII